MIDLPYKCATNNAGTFAAARYKINFDKVIQPAIQPVESRSSFLLLWNEDLFQLIQQNSVTGNVDVADFFSDLFNVFHFF